MANTIRIKRRTSGAAGAPASLKSGELAYNNMDNTVYAGFGDDGGGNATSVKPIGGEGSFVLLGGAQTISGDKAFTGAATAITQTATDNSQLIATTAFVKAQGYAIAARAINSAANSGLAGGGDLSADRSLSLDINNLTLTTTSTATDMVAIYDGVSTKKISKSNFISGLGGGTVTSVGLSAPSIFTVGGSPITSSGTLTLTLASQTANTIFAAPNGAAGAPTFRGLVAADIPSLTAAKISDFDTQVRTSRLDQMAAPTAAVSLNAQKITGLADPTAAQDAATKAYVDATSQGLDVKTSVKAATTANITLSAAQTIDGVALVAGDRVLVKNQTTASGNGIYVVAAGAWTRATDADSSAKVHPGIFVFVEQGTTNADSGWVLTTDGAITLDTTALTFAQFSGAGQITAGAGLTKTGNQLDVGGTANRITVAADAIDIAATYVGQTSITTLGTITTGVWNGTTIALANGGTGATTAAGARANLGAAASGANSDITSLSGLTTALSVAQGGTGATTLTGYVKGNGTAAMTASATIPGADISGNIAGNAANVTGTVAIANGGTGSTTAANARTALGLDTMATQSAATVAITGGSITNLTTFDGVTIDGGTF